MQEEGRLFLFRLFLILRGHILYFVVHLGITSINFFILFRECRTNPGICMNDTSFDYWKLQLGDVVFVLNLPSDSSTSRQQLHKQLSETEILFSESLSQSLQSLDGLLKPFGQSDKSLLTIFLSIYSIVLNRYTSQADIVIGTLPIYDCPTLENAESSSSNSVGIRVVLDTSMTFRELLKQVHTTLRLAHAHQDLSFDAFAEIISSEQGYPPSKLQVFLGLAGLQQQGGSDTINSSQYLWNSGEKYDMALWISGHQTRLCLRAVYNNALFSNVRIKCMLDQFYELLEQAIRQPDASIASYSLITPESKTHLPDPSLPISPPVYNLVGQQFLKHASVHPNNPAVRQYGRSCTYGELRQRAETVAHRLLLEGLERGEVVAIYGSRSLGLITGILGVMLGGGAFLLIDPNFPLKRIKVMLQQAAVNYGISISGSPVPDLPEFTTSPLSINAESGEIEPSHQTAKAHDQVLPDVQADDPACVFFTSGTTGTPKGILSDQKSLAHFLSWQRETFAIDSADRCAHLTAVSFDVVLRDIFLPLTSGAVLCIPDALPMPPEKILNWLQEEQITSFNIVPTLAQFWLDYAPVGFSLESLRWVFFAGEPLTDRLINQWQKTFVGGGRIVNFYGQTETGLAKCCYQTSEGIYAGVQPVGRALPYAQALVLSPNDHLCGVGEVGEIVFRTPFMTSGYLSQAAERNSFRPNPFTSDPTDLLYYTGDIGRYHPLGILEILGRSDDQVKISGVRIEPAETTAVLSSHPVVRSCVVIPLRSKNRLPYLVAYVVPSTSKPENECRNELKAFLTERLPTAFVPSTFVFLTELPRKVNGKIDRQALPIPEHQSEVIADEALPPRNLAERRLASIWERILNRSPINLHDNFFDLGGTSMQALYLVAEIERQFGLTFSLDVLIESPVLEQLAAQVATGGVSTGAYVTLVKEGKNPPLFCVSGTGGHVFRLRPFAVHLQTDQPVYGLHFPGIDGHEEPCETVEDVAIAMLEKIRAKQPQGPYYLAGYSYGGQICYEMAQRLTAAGEHVGLLILLDTFAHPPITADYNEKLLAMIKAEEEEEVFVFDHLRKILEANQHAEKIYSPPVDICGKVALFRTDQSHAVQNSPTLDWAPLVPSGVTIYPVQGTHDTMVEDPYAKGLAEKVRMALLKELKGVSG